MDKLPRYELVITLNSNLSVSSGDAITGVVDLEITHEYGLPIIPAKRLKGALRGVAKELVDWGVVEETDVQQLFGEVGQEKMAGFKMYDATLYQLPNGCFKSDLFTINDYDHFSQQIRKYPERELLQLFTMLYTKTATSNDIAETGSLRTIRVINHGLVFKSIIELANDRHVELLEFCVKGLRHLGLARTRGLGEVSCQINKVEDYKQTEMQEVDGRQAFRITLQQPTLLAGNNGLYYSCANYVPGSALLGAFASLYIQKKNLGAKAHLDEDFARIFLRGGVTFGYAYPEIDRKKFIPCPLHIQREKNRDYAYYESTSIDKTLRKIGPFVHMENEQLYLHEPKQEFRMHHARPADRRYGRAINDTPGKIDISRERGQFYFYRALSKNQSFVAELKGSQEDVAQLFHLLKSVNDTIQLGRSRTAEYGAAKIEILDELPKSGFEQASIADNQVAIYFATPLTLQNQHGRYVADPNLLIAEFEQELGVSLTIEKMYLQHTTLSGYHAKWRLPKQEREALNAGTVLIVSCEVSEEKVDWARLAHKRWGMEAGQGCGEIAVLKIPDGQIKCNDVAGFYRGVSSEENADLDRALLEFISHQLAKSKEIRRIQVVAKKIAKNEMKKFEGYSNSHIYKLKQCTLKESGEVEESEETKEFAKNIRNKAKNELTVTFKEDEELIECFIKSYFYMIQLEVRKGVFEK
mgnify:CR=1 FL=1